MTTTSSNTAPTDEQLLDGAYEGPVRIRGRLRRLLWWLVPGYFAIYVLWGAIPGLLLALQVTDVDPDPRAKVANLLVVTTVGAFCAMIAQPIAGLVSDRTRSRWGRRAPWMVIGTVAGGVSLVALGQQHTIVGVAICWSLVQISYNFAQGPLSAIMPDRVPRLARGSFAAISGIGMMVGILGGTFLGAAFKAAIPVGYLALGVFAVVVTLLFVTFNRERPSVGLPREPFSFRAFLSTFWVDPVAHPDFFWAFTGRLLLYTGYFAVIGYNLYILSDYIGVGSDRAADLVPLLSLVGLPALLVAVVISGPLSDRLKRRKIFVFLSSVFVAIAMVFPIVMPTVTGMLIMSVVASFGFGMFQAVDTVLMTEVLPSAETFGKDLGVVNIAATLPQTIAPVVSGGIVLLLGGYVGLFPLGIVLSILGALAVWPIKATR